MTIPILHLPNGTPIPAVGFGTGTAWYKSEKDPLNRELIESIKSALANGYRHLDCAEIYGTEPEVGVAIKESGVKREDLFITAKSFDTLGNPEEGLKESLRKLQTDHVDLYLIHAPFLTPKHNTTIPKIWESLEKLQKAGKTRSIGVSNFTTPQLESLLSHATILPTCNQVEFNPYCQDIGLSNFCRKNNILLSAYGPLTSLRKFTDGPLTPVIKRIAEQKGRTEAQVLLQWVIEQGFVVITTSSKVERQVEFAGVGWELGEDAIAEITKVGGKEHHRLFWLSDYE